MKIKVYVDFYFKYYLGKKDVNYISVPQQKDRRSGKWNPLNGGTASKINPFFIIAKLIKLGVLTPFSCIRWKMKNIQINLDNVN